VPRGRSGTAHVRPVVGVKKGTIKRTSYTIIGGHALGEVPGERVLPLTLKPDCKLRGYKMQCSR
jgi:hypothetical protein